MKVGICTPHGGKVSPAWMRAVQAMEGAAINKHQFFHVDVELMIVGKGRNMTVETALREGLDVLFHIDDDVLVPENAHILIDQAMSLGIVSGLYFSRRLPYTPQLYKKAEGVADEMYWPYIEYPDNQIFEVDAVGAGCLAFTASTARQMQKHYTELFKQQSELLTDPLLKRTVRNLSPWFEFLDKRGEDMYFCELATHIGLKIWANTNIKCLHESFIPIGEDNFKYLVDNDLLQMIDPDGNMVPYKRKDENEDPNSSSSSG